MRRTCIYQAICCLLIFLLLMGCNAEAPVSEVPESVFSGDAGTFDPAAIPGDYAALNFNLNHESVTNAEGQELHWSKNQFGDSVFPPEGSMPFYHYRPSDALEADVWVPYSESFTVQTRVPSYGHSYSFSASFNKDSFWVSDMMVSGSLEGTATLSEDNSMYLNGTHSRITFVLWVNEGENHDISTSSRIYCYELEGGAGENTKIRLEGDEIIAEGLTEGYTVTKTDYRTDEVLWTKDYPADSGNG